MGHSGGKKQGQTAALLDSNTINCSRPLRRHVCLPSVILSLNQALHSVLAGGLRSEGDPGSKQKVILSVVSSGTLRVCVLPMSLYPPLRVTLGEQPLLLSCIQEL